jgi:hypothetical protein
LSESDWIFEELGSAIKALIERFIETPYFFYSEQDMHAYLYHKLISGRLGKSLVQTHFGDRTALLHREYPTLRAYPSKGRSKRGRFDLAILDPVHASESHWRMQTREPPYSRHRLKAAVEFGLNAIGTTRLDLTHFRKDFECLTDPKNMVERGYLLFFVRRQDYGHNSGLLRVIDSLPDRLEQAYEQNRDRANNLVVVYAECRFPGTRGLRIIPEGRSSWIG